MAEKVAQVSEGAVALTEHHTGINYFTLSIISVLFNKLRKRFERVIGESN